MVDLLGVFTTGGGTSGSTIIMGTGITGLSVPKVPTEFQDQRSRFGTESPGEP
jgi:hypothetical protein